MTGRGTLASHTLSPSILSLLLAPSLLQLHEGFSIGRSARFGSTWPALRGKSIALFNFSCSYFVIHAALQESRSYAKEAF